jgi:excisionase family DNA binding protein
MDQITKTNATQTSVVFEPLINSRDAAELLHMHFKTLERWARTGQIPGYQYVPGDSWYFRASELDNWLRSKLNSAASQSVRVN